MVVGDAVELDAAFRPVVAKETLPKAAALAIPKTVSPCLADVALVAKANADLMDVSRPLKETPPAHSSPHPREENHILLYRSPPS